MAVPPPAREMLIWPAALRGPLLWLLRLLLLLPRLTARELLAWPGVLPAWALLAGLPARALLWQLRLVLLLFSAAGMRPSVSAASPSKRETNQKQQNPGQHHGQNAELNDNGLQW